MEYLLVVAVMGNFDLALLLLLLLLLLRHVALVLRIGALGSIIVNIGRWQPEEGSGGGALPTYLAT